MGSRSKLIALGGAALMLVSCSVPPSFSEDEKVEMRDTTSEYQQAVLEDLEVSETQYRDAVTATRDCVQDKGWGVGPIEQDGNQLGFQSSAGDEVASSEEVMQDCYDEYLNDVGAVWLSQRTSLT